MRITPDILLRVARETAQKFALKEPGLVAAYLTGSLRGSDPFIGNSTDVDIVLVHESKPKVQREIQPLTPEVHLDISHTSRAEYEKPKALRTDPWLGPEMYDPLPLYGKQLFFEFVQAGVRADFDDPANILGRARRYAGHAREVWSGLQAGQENDTDTLPSFLKSVHHAANAAALLTGNSLSERRFLLQFGQCAAILGKPGLSSMLMEMLGGTSLDEPSLQEFLPGWEASFLEAAGRNKAHASISPHRLGYYRNAFTAMLEGEFPHAILWPLVHTWSLAAQVLPPTRQASWHKAGEILGFTGAAFDGKLKTLDSFIDVVDETLDEFGARYGI